MQSVFDYAAFQPLDTPREAGRIAAEACAAKAVRLGWDKDGAMEFVVRQLRRRGEASSEMLTDLAIAAGYVPHVPQAFGQVYKDLIKAKRIVFVRSCPRLKGHGTRGGSVYRAVE